MLDKDFSRDDFFKKFPNARTFPQITINKEHVGGYAELERWLKKNIFDENF
jgi:glutaredoxin